MDSTDTYTADSKSEDSPEPRFAEKTTHIRFLVPKALAGSVIGQGGSRIVEFQGNSGARILLSRNGQYYPGTTDRVVVVSGTVREVYIAVGLVLRELLSELQAVYGSDAELKRRRIIVPHSSAGCIIGKGGAIIKSIIEYSKADIKISPLDNTYTGLSDRLLTLSGAMEAQMRAIDLILNRLTEDDIYSQQVHSPNSYAGIVEICLRELVEGYTIGKGGLYFQQEILGRYHYGFHGCNSVNYARCPLASIQNHKEGEFKSVTIGVSDKYIGLVLGPNGRKIKQINLLTGARLKILGRGDFVSGTTDSTDEDKILSISFQMKGGATYNVTMRTVQR